MAKTINALFGGQPENLTYVGYGTCPECGDDCAEIWSDESTGKRYARCPYFMCDGWGKLRELGIESDTVEYERNTDGSYKCPICGCVVDYDVRGDDERIITMDDYVIPFNHCPKCGARIEVDE